MHNIPDVIFQKIFYGNNKSNIYINDNKSVAQDLVETALEKTKTYTERKELLTTDTFKQLPEDTQKEIINKIEKQEDEALERIDTALTYATTTEERKQLLNSDIFMQLSKARQSEIRKEIKDGASWTLMAETVRKGFMDMDIKNNNHWQNRFRTFFLID